MSTSNLPRFSILDPKNAHPEFSGLGTSAGLQLPEALAQNKAFSEVFRKGRVTLGLIAPFKGYPDSPFADLEDLGELAALADRLGFAALWVRDVPFYDPGFGDVGQGYDPMVTLGYLAARTQRIALGTAGFVSPLREPIHMAKAAVSTDRLSGGRFLLGLSSGDRPVEYPAFKVDFDNRAERFRESWEMIRTLTEQSFPKFSGTYYGSLQGNIDLVPKASGRLPMIAIGRARQELDWLANTADAWIWHGVDPKNTCRIVDTLAELGDGRTWHPFGYANFLELTEDPNEPARLFNNIFLRGGSKAVAEFWAQQREEGLSHVIINLKPTRRPAAEVLQELAENVLPVLG